MKHTERWLRILAIFSVIAISASCSSREAAREGDLMRASSAPARLMIRSGEIAVSVSDPKKHAPQVERIISEANGFVERSTADESSVWLSCRVPAESLEGVIDEIAGLGKVLRRSVSSRDVTEQHSDLNARLTNSRELRDRMRVLLERANDVQDVLAIEKELSRLQTEIESMEGQLSRLDSQIQLSNLSVQLKQERILGPLGYVGYWTFWAFSKLFVIR